MQPILLRQLLLFLCLYPLICAAQQQPGFLPRQTIDSARAITNANRASIMDPAGLFSVAFTPNAKADFLTIETDEKNRSRFSVQFLSVTGDEIYTYSQLGPERAELDLSQLRAGIYLVYVENTKGDRVFYKLLKR